MRWPRLRVRTLMALVGLVALLLWGGMIGTRSFLLARRAREFGQNEYGWRMIAARKGWNEKHATECVDYYAELARKYRRAAWRPWLAVAPDPHAPGYDLWLEQERRKMEGARDPGTN